MIEKGITKDLIEGEALETKIELKKKTRKQFIVL